MGYSGGVKTAAIGLTSRKTIRQNHSHLTSPLSFTGNYANNPCRVDVEEIGKMIGVDLALNLILNTNKQIMHALFGDPFSVIQNGIPISEHVCQVLIQKPYDLVLVSPGGYPKDINFYQAHKAVTNAAALTRSGGRIILIAECREGSGSRPFQQFMTGIGSADEVLVKFDQIGFEIGPHKAYLLARQLKRIRLSVYSLLPDDLARSLLLEPISLSEISAQLELAGRTNASIAFLPFGVNTVPSMMV
jgi:nickel-dependent lactate racemase